MDQRASIEPARSEGRPEGSPHLRRAAAVEAQGGPSRLKRSHPFIGEALAVTVPADDRPLYKKTKDRQRGRSADPSLFPTFTMFRWRLGFIDRSLDRMQRTTPYSEIYLGIWANLSLLLKWRDGFQPVTFKFTDGVERHAAESSQVPGETNTEVGSCMCSGRVACRWIKLEGRMP
jgi:hypothetical protein